MSEQEFDKKISQAWRDAGRELGIRVTAPFNLKIEGHDITVEAFIRDFGGPNGTIAVASETSCFRPSLKGLGSYVSQLFPSYRVYSREHFIATLDDCDGLGLLEKSHSGTPASPGPNRVHQSGDKTFKG